MKINDDNYDFEVLDWMAGGYRGFRLPKKGSQFPERAKKTPWYAVCVIISQIKRGHFGEVKRLFEIHGQEMSPTLDRVCGDIFGDAGPTEVWTHLLKDMQNYDVDFYLNLDNCRSVGSRGRLADIPALLDVMELYSNLRDRDMIPLYIAGILDPGDDSVFNDVGDLGGFKPYRQYIENLTQDLAARFGSDDVYVFRGEILDVTRVAKLVIQYARQGNFPIDLRRKFEVMTGVNCSSFYDELNFQPLCAQAVAEDFLDSPKVDLYQPGSRYFFGRPVP